MTNAMTQQDVERLLVYLKKRSVDQRGLVVKKWKMAHVACALVGLAGLRFSEVVKVKTKDIDLDGPEPGVWVRGGNGAQSNEKVKARLRAEAVPILQEYLRWKREQVESPTARPYLLASQLGHMRKKDLERVVAEATDGSHEPYQLRQHYGLWVYSQTRDIQSAREALRPDGGTELENEFPDDLDWTVWTIFGPDPDGTPLAQKAAERQLERRTCSIEGEGYVLAETKACAWMDSGFADRWFELAVYLKPAGGYLLHIRYQCRDKFKDEDDVPCDTVYHCSTRQRLMLSLGSYDFESHIRVRYVVGHHTCFIETTERYVKEFLEECSKAVTYIRDEVKRVCEELVTGIKERTNDIDI